jgi:hypothetical protein
VSQSWIDFFNSAIASVKSLTSIVDLFSKDKANRKAVFLPIPGREAIWSTAFSNIFDGMFMDGKFSTLIVNFKE